MWCLNMTMSFVSAICRVRNVSTFFTYTIFDFNTKICSYFMKLQTFLECFFLLSLNLVKCLVWFSNMVTKPQKGVYDKQILYISSWSLFYINYEKLRDTSFPIFWYRNIIRDFIQIWIETLICSVWILG